MTKYNFILSNQTKRIVFKLVASLVLILSSIHVGSSQIINLPCQSNAESTIEIDRKIFTGAHSQGYLHNFILPNAPTGGCKKIQNIEIDIDIISVDNSGLGSCNIGNFYYNFYQGCPMMTGNSCPTTNLIDEPNSPVLTSNTFPYVCIPGVQEFQFGDVLGVDIVPAMDPGSCPNWQNIIGDGSFSAVFNICVTVTIVDATPTATVDLGSDLIVCPTATTTIDAGTFDNYMWSPGGQMTQTITAGVGTYNLTVTDNAGCTSTDEIIVSEFADSPITFNPSNPSGCDGGNVQVNVVESYGSYNWSNALTGQSVSLSPGSYTVTITDSNNCTFESNVTVGDLVSPNAGINNFITVCNNGTLIDVNAQLGPHDNGGMWSDDDASGININTNPTSIDFSSLTPGSYNYTYTVLGTAPCPNDQATITVQIVDANFSGISNAEQYCQDPGNVNFFDLLSNPTLGGNFIDVNNSLVNLSDGSAVNLNGLAPNIYEFIYNLDINGPCPGSQTQLFITIVASVEAGENDIATVCEGAQVDLSDLLSANADLGGTFSDDDFTGELVGTIFNTTGLAGQSYDFTYNVGSAGGQCGVDMAFFTITVESNVTSGGDTNQNICAGEEIDLYDILMGEDAGGVFSDISGNGGLSNNMLNTTGLPTGINEYQYLIGDGVSCPKDSSLISINILSAPTIDTPIDSISVCVDNCETITFNLSGTAPFSFSTSVFSESGSIIGGGVNTTSNSTFTITACNQGNNESFVNDTLNLLIDSSYIIIIPSIEDDNCTNNFGGTEDTIHIQGLDYARFELDTMACINDTLTFNGIELFDGNATLVDTLAGQFCDSIVNISVTFSTADTVLINPTICQEDFIQYQGTTYNISQPSDTIQIINPNGCDSLIIIDLGFYPMIDSTINLELCSGDSLVVNGVSYKFGNETGTETLSDQSSNGCDSIVNINLTFTDDIIILRNDTLCSGQDIMIGGETFNESNPLGTVDLTGSGCDTTIMVDLTFLDAIPSTLEGPECSSFNISINGNLYDINNPIGQETLVGQSAAGCDSIITINLSFYPVSLLDIIEEFCEDGDIVVNGTIYDVNNPIGQEIIPNGSINGCDSTINITLTFTPLFEIPVSENPCVGDSFFVAGAFQFTDGEYRDTFQTVDNCDSIIVTTLTFSPCVFNVDIDPTDDVCGSNSGSIVITTDSPIGELFSIELEDNENNTQVIALAEGPNIGGTFNNLGAGTYIIKILDSTGMVVYESTVTILNTGATITGIWDLTTPIECENGTGSITYTPTGGQSPYQFQWSDLSIGNTGFAENLLAGDYSLTVTDDLGCTGEATFQLLDGLSQIVTLEMLAPSCNGASDGSISIIGLNNTDGPYEISVNGTVADSTNIPNLTTGTYQIVITDINLCIITLEETLTSTDDIQFAEYLETYSITVGDSINIVGSIDTGTYIYEWSPIDNSFSCTDCALPVASPLGTTVYDLIITDINGCSQSININIEVEPIEIVDVVPNIFSPNGDGANDDFIFRSGSENLTGIQIGIYDRWGNLVYQETSTNGSVTWNGRMNDTLLSSGVYIYQITVLYNDDTSKNLYGDVTLIH